MTKLRQQYRYALAASGAVIDVLAIDDTTRHQGAPYYCLGCDKEMIPHLGYVRVKHFAHRRNEHCTLETYLHSAAKQLFLAMYISARATRRPVVLEWRHPVECNHHSRRYGFTCSQEVTESIELTKYFDTIALEKAYQGFRPDVLLSSTHHPDVLFVEFTVTHPCDPAKLATGLRVLEIAIPDEAALPRLLDQRFGVDYPGRTLHNLRAPTLRDVCGGRCWRKVLVLLVHPSRRFTATTVEISKIVSGQCGRGDELCRVLGSADEIDDHDAAIRDAARDALWAKIPVQDCRVCRHYSARPSRRFPVSCRLLPQDCNPSTALRCTYYEPVRSPDDAAEVDRLAAIEWLSDTAARPPTRHPRR